MSSCILSFPGSRCRMLKTRCAVNSSGNNLMPCGWSLGCTLFPLYQIRHRFPRDFSQPVNLPIESNRRAFSSRSSQLSEYESERFLFTHRRRAIPEGLTRKRSIERWLVAPLAQPLLLQNRHSCDSCDYSQKERKWRRDLDLEIG